MAVLSAPRGGPATVNLMAPIVVNASTRKGAQVHLEGTRFSTRELFVLPKAEANEGPAARDAASAP
jgi:flagellar assembly factor FliW